MAISLPVPAGSAWKLPACDASRRVERAARCRPAFWVSLLCTTEEKKMNRGRRKRKILLKAHYNRVGPREETSCVKVARVIRYSRVVRGSAACPSIPLSTDGAVRKVEIIDPAGSREAFASSSSRDRRGGAELIAVTCPLVINHA